MTSIVVTGRGVISAIGTSVDAFEESLLSARGGIGRHEHLIDGQTVFAALVEDFQPPPGLEAVAKQGFDRTAAMAAHAVNQALSEAGIWQDGRLGVDGDRVALLLGSSHGGRSQLDRFVETGSPTDDESLAHGVLERGAHHHQTAIAAAYFGIHGPVVTMSTACSSSGTAISYGIELLRSGRVDVVVAGGADGFSKLTYAGFSALGATADGPCGPFGSRIGMNLGEGAAFLVLERESDAEARGAKPIARMLGCGTSWDAYHLTAPEPSGDGMSRAIRKALAMARLDASTVDYVNAHATGTRANDVAETLALARVFDEHAVPPVSATKSFTGHTLGASSALGFLAGLAAMRHDFLPPTLNFEAPRAGCNLDYVPGKARKAPVNRFLAQSAAFGGVNCVLAGGEPSGEQSAAPAPERNVVITGLGMITPLGCGADEFFESVRNGRTAATSDMGGNQVAAVSGFDPRRHIPGGRARRMDPITQYALAAVSQALTDAGMGDGKRDATRTGLMVGLCRGAAQSFEDYLDSVRGGRWEKASPTAFPNLVMSSVGGRLAIAAGLKGVASTVVGGAEVGFSLLAVAAETLRRRDDMDAIVVVAADELTPLFLQLEQVRGHALPLSSAEGAVALVMEREDRARTRGATIHAELAGWAETFDATPGPGMDDGGIWLTRALRQAMTQADCQPDDIDLAVTLARGETGYDSRAVQALAPLINGHAPATSTLAGHVGHAEATAGLYAVAGSLLSLQHGHLPAPASNLHTASGTPWLSQAAQGTFRTAAAFGSGKFGGNGAVVLRRPRT